MWIKKPKAITKQQGIAYGTMDGVVNVLGVLLSLSIATDSKIAVITGVLAAGLANALANSSGFYVSEETEGLFTEKEIIVATVVAFFSSLVSALLVLLPTIFLNHRAGIWYGFAIGIVLLFLIGFLFSHTRKSSSLKIGIKYIFIGIIVSFLGFVLGSIIDRSV